jgi:hypothetical protein
MKPTTSHQEKSNRASCNNLAALPNSCCLTTLSLPGSFPSSTHERSFVRGRTQQERMDNLMFCLDAAIEISSAGIGRKRNNNGDRRSTTQVLQ